MIDLTLNTNPESAVIQVTGTSVEAVAAVAGIRYVVTGFLLGSDTATTMTFKSGSTVICGGLPLAANSPGGHHVPRGDFLFKTALGEALNITFSVSATVGGIVKYHKLTV